MLKNVVILLFGCCVFMPSSVTAQQNGSADAWRSVSARSAGEVLKIKLKDGSAVRGKLTSTGDTGLVIEQKNKELSLSRDEITSVSVVRKRSAGKAAVIGMAVGLGAGAGAGAAFGATQNTGIFTRGQNVGLGAVIFGAIGATAGALIGFAAGHAGHKETVIYQSLPTT